MLTRNQIATFLGLSAVYWMLFLLVRGVPVTVDLLLPFGVVVGAVSITLGIFNRWAWHWRIFNGWLVNRPYVQGTWKVTLKSDWKNPESGEQISPIDAFLVIRQTGSDISLRLFTTESRSETVSSGIETCKDGTFEISCTYRNKPGAEFRHRSEVHYGAMILFVDQKSPGSVEGDYWTDRKTTGTVLLTERKAKLAASYRDAEELFASQ